MDLGGEELANSLEKVMICVSEQLQKSGKYRASRYPYHLLPPTTYPHSLPPPSQFPLLLLWIPWATLVDTLLLTKVHRLHKWSLSGWVSLSVVYRGWCFHCHIIPQKGFTTLTLLSSPKAFLPNPWLLGSDFSVVILWFLLFAFHCLPSSASFKMSIVRPRVRFSDCLISFSSTGLFPSCSFNDLIALFFFFKLLNNHHRPPHPAPDPFTFRGKDTLVWSVLLWIWINPRLPKNKKLLKKIPLYEYTMVCLSIHLLKDIFAFLINPNLLGSFFEMSN